MHGSRYLISLVLLFLLLAFSSCNSSGDSADGDAVDGDVADGDWTDGDHSDGDADIVVDGDSEPEQPSFTHQVYEESQDAALSDIATGEFELPALSYPAIPVPTEYKHLLNFQITPFLPPWRKAIPTNGPLVLFTDELDVIVFSPLDHFFISLVSFEEAEIRYGLIGDVNDVPAGFTHRFIKVEGKGINATIARWGELMREEYQTDIRDPYADPGLSYIGYWTDNGAYYYYNTEPEMNEEDTLLAVKADADAMGIPYGYFQLDSWWYFKEFNSGLLPGTGLVLWEPQPEMFPEGLTAFQQKLGLPLILHNRWFAEENNYLEMDDFVFHKGMALPKGRAVYDRFMEDAVKWKAFTYEQDWLVTQYWGIPWLREAPGRAKLWMDNMHGAAADKGLTMQLCMSGAAHLLDSLRRPAVTTIRTSTDYQPSVSKETYYGQFHTINMLAAAVGLWPFKDNFHSSEDHAEAEALISTLSAGMLGAGDQIGVADKALIMRSCRADGLLLKPDRPVTPIDAMFLEHQRPYITATESKREGLGSWTYMAAYHLAREHEERDYEDELHALLMYEGQDLGDMFVWPDAVSDWRVDPVSDLGIKGPVVLYDWRKAEARIVDAAFDMQPFPHLYDHAYYVFAPILDNGLALIGEADKFVTLADKRFTEIQVSENALEITLAGVPGEAVSLLVYDTEADSLLDPVTVTIGESGAATVTLSR